MNIKQNEPGGSGGGQSSIYECQFCGAYHIRGEICTKFVKALSKLSPHSEQKGGAK